MADSKARIVVSAEDRTRAVLQGISANLGRTQRSVESLGRAFSILRGGVVGGVVLDVAQRLGEQADAYSNLNARLKLVTGDSNEFARAQKGVFDIAQLTGTGLQETAGLYGTLSTNLQGLGVSQERLLGVTSTINKALAVSGTNAQSAAAAIVQLNQGFASGTLRGEELNSVLEQAPRLAKAIADGLGVSIGELRDLGKAGQLTSESVFAALEKSAAKINEEFRTLPLTIARAQTEASNAFLKLIGDLDQSTGVSVAFAQSLSDAAKEVAALGDEIRNVSQGVPSDNVAAQVLVALIETVRVLGANFSFVFKGIGREIGAVAAQLAALGRFDLQGFRAISDAVKEDAERARVELDAFEKRVLSRVARPDLGQSDRRELARRGRPATPFGTPAPPKRPDDGGRVGNRSAAKEQLSDAQRYLENLQNQLQATKDLSVEQTVLADIERGRLKLAKGESAQPLIDIAAQIDQFRRQQDQLKAEAEQVREFRAEQEKLKAAGVAVFEATRTPREKLAADIDELRALLDKGAISTDTYYRRVQQLDDAFEELGKQKDAVKELDDYTQRAAQNIQDALGEELSSLLDGNFRNIGDSFKRTLDRMVSEAIAADLNRALFGNIQQTASGGKGGGLFEGLISAGFGLLGGGGGANTTDFRGTILPNSLRGGAATGTNLVERDMVTLLHKGEAVVPKQYNPAAGGSGGRSVTINFTQNIAPGTSRETAAQAAAGARRALEAGARNL